MRLYAILALADGRTRQIVDAMPRVALVKLDAHRHQHLLYLHGSGTIVDTIVFPLRNNVSLPVASNAPSGKWDIYLLAPDSRNSSRGAWRHTARLMRKLIRARQGDSQGWVLGPWSVAEFVQRWPARAAALIDDGWPVLLGDSQETVTAIDYRPTLDDAEDDTEFDPEEVLP